MSRSSIASKQQASGLAGSDCRRSPVCCGRLPEPSKARTGRFAAVLFQSRDVAGDFRHGLEDERLLRMRIGAPDAPRRTLHHAICSLSFRQVERVPAPGARSPCVSFQMALLRLTSRGAVCLRGSGFMQQRRNNCAFTSVCTSEPEAKCQWSRAIVLQLFPSAPRRL
jgi:hypothetical protein